MGLVCEREMFHKAMIHFWYVAYCQGHPVLLLEITQCQRVSPRGKNIKQSKTNKHNSSSFHLLSATDMLFSSGNWGLCSHVLSATGTNLLVIRLNLGGHLEGLEVRLNSLPCWFSGIEFCYGKKSCNDAADIHIGLWRTDPRLLIVHIPVKYIYPSIVTLWPT